LVTATAAEMELRNDEALEMSTALVRIAMALIGELPEL
jgi:hypothetical protein